MCTEIYNTIIFLFWMCVGERLAAWAAQPTSPYSYLFSILPVTMSLIQQLCPYTT